LSFLNNDNNEIIVSWNNNIKLFFLNDEIIVSKNDEVKSYIFCKKIHFLSSEGNS